MHRGLFSINCSIGATDGGGLQPPPGLGQKILIGPFFDDDLSLDPKIGPFFGEDLFGPK